MWLAIGKFFSAVLKLVLGIFTGILNWVREHPKAAAAIVFFVIALVVSNYQTMKWATAKEKERNEQTIATLRKTLDEQRGEVEKANRETSARDAKIAVLEADSKKAAENTQTALAESAKTAQSIVEEYEEKLKKEKGKYKIVYVKDPTSGKDVPINFDGQGKVVCDRLSDSFLEATNKLVANANKPLVKGEAK